MMYFIVTTLILQMRCTMSVIMCYNARVTTDQMCNVCNQMLQYHGNDTNTRDHVYNICNYVLQCHSNDTAI